jgi:hypothetical protein
MDDIFYDDCKHPEDIEQHSSITIDDEPQDNVINIGRRAFLFGIATLPVLISSGGALIVLWRLPPKGVTHRFLVVIGLNCGYLLSAYITAITRITKRSRKWYFLTILIKDSFVSAASLVLSIMSIIGGFNNCEGWAPLHNRFVVLDQKSFEHNWKYIYPIVFWVELVLQAGVFLLLYFVIHKKGFKVL